MRAVAAFLLVLCYLAVTHAWNCDEGTGMYNVTQVDAGQGMVIVRDTSGYVYFLIGSSWHRMSTTEFKHASVGPAGIWATGNTRDKVYKYIAGNFQIVTSGQAMQQVDAGGNGQVVGVYYDNNYCLSSTSASAYSGSGALTWTSLSKAMTYISCGPYGCWGVDKTDKIFFTPNMTPTSCDTREWTQIEGAAVMVEVGTDGKVFVVNRGGMLWERTGIADRTPQGTGWNHVSVCMKVRHVSLDLGTMWVVTNIGLLLKCTQ
ncbi:fish-egg lectin-like [Acanthopagrus schlegelii]